MRRAHTRLLLLAVLGGAGLSAAACGTSAPPRPATATEVFGSALHALERGDLAALDATLSPAAREQVRRDLRAWRDELVDPVEGPRLLARLPGGAAAPKRPLVDKALAGDPASLLALYVAIDPHAAAATPTPPEPAASPALLHYRAANGMDRRVVLTKRGDAWTIEQLTL